MILKRLQEFRDEALSRAGYRSSKTRRYGQDDRNILEVIRSNRVKLINSRMDALEDIKAARKSGGVLPGIRERFAPEEGEPETGTSGQSWRGRHRQAPLPSTRGQKVRILR